MQIPYDNNLATLFGLSQMPTNSYEFGGQAFTTQELWCKIAEKINIIIEHFNYLDKNFTNEKENTNKKLEYLLGEGLAEQVARRILELIADGTLGKLINETILADINNKVDENRTFLDNKIDTIKATLEGVISTNRETLENKLSEMQVSITDFGATPNDITVDNSVFIQQAIDFISTRGGGKVFIPKGTFYVKNVIDLKAYVWLVGVGSTRMDTNDKGSVIEYNGEFIQNIIQAHKLGTEQYYRYGVGIKDLQVRGKDIGNGVSLKSCANTSLDNVVIEFCNRGLVVEGGMLDTYNRVFIRYCKSNGLYYPNTLQSTTQVFNSCYIGQHRSSETCIPLQIDNHATTDIIFNNLTLESNNLRCKIGVATTVKFNDLYVENCPVKDTTVIELGYHDGNGWDLDNYNGVYTINGGLTMGVPSSLGGYVGKNLLHVNFADSLNISDCFITKFESLLTVKSGLTINPTLINCTMENGLVTNKFNTMKYATIINCRQDGTTIINNTPKQDITPPFMNNWTNTGSGYHDFQVTKQGNLVNIVGVVKGGSDYTIATLPVGSRPKGRFLTTCYVYNSSTSEWSIQPLHIYADGAIQMNNSLNGNTSFDITFEV